LTPIHLDHEVFLGNTIAKIAAEKAAIIKRGTHAVIGRQFREAFPVICAAVRKNRGHLWRAKPVSSKKLGLEGSFQKMNAGVAWKAVAILQEYFDFPVNRERSAQGLRSCSWMGRMEIFKKHNRTFVLDGAHNPISVKQLVAEYKKKPGTKGAWLIFGAMADKNSRRMLRILSGFFERIVLTQVNNPRAKPVALLLQEAKGLFKTILTAENTPEAVAIVEKISKPRGAAIVTGSFYLVGEARKLLKNRGLVPRG
jgi:dihydrofolate synthase / folylpolyglutamate synthase